MILLRKTTSEDICPNLQIQTCTEHIYKVEHESLAEIIGQIPDIPLEDIYLNFNYDEKTDEDFVELWFKTFEYI